MRFFAVHTWIFWVRVRLWDTINNFLGSVAGQNNTTGNYNNFIGASAGWSNLTGSYNNFIGAGAGNYNVSGGSNTVLGDSAGYGASGQSYSGNTLAGYKSGYGLSTGSRNLLLGWQAGDSLTTGSDNIIIGYNADAPSASTRSFLNIGNAIYGDLANGNVGIGTTGPGAKLDISGSGNMRIGFDYAGTNSILKTFTTPHSAANVPSQFDLGINDGGTVVGMIVKNIRDGSYNSQSIEFATHHGNVSAGTRMMIDKDGDVGIGTTSPEAKLEVAGQVKITGGTPSAGKVLTSDAAGLASWQAAVAVPSGAVMFFNLASCPSGWTDKTTAWGGRYLVTLPSGGTLTGTVGTALSNQENRATGQHNHAITDPGHTHTMQRQGGGGGSMGSGNDDNESTGATGSSTTGISIQDAGTVAGANAPYIQFLVCQKD